MNLQLRLWAIGVILLSALIGCGSTVEDVMPSVLDAGTLFVDRDCEPRASKIEIIDEQGLYTLWLSSPSRSDTDHYILTFLRDQCDLIIQQRVPFEHLKLRPDLIAPDATILDGTPQGNDVIGAVDGIEWTDSYLLSNELESRLAVDWLADCRRSGPLKDGSYCLDLTTSLFDSRTALLRYLPPIPSGAEVNLEVVEGIAYFNGVEVK